MLATHTLTSHKFVLHKFVSHKFVSHKYKWSGPMAMLSGDCPSSAKGLGEDVEYQGSGDAWA